MNGRDLLVNFWTVMSHDGLHFNTIEYIDKLTK